VYPKYVVLFPDVRVDQPGDSAFRVHGLPPAEWWLSLAVGSDNDMERIDNLKITCVIEVKGSER
jgi:hypothetical protein